MMAAVDVFLTPSELPGVLKAAQARSVRDWVMILFAYRRGLRASEACNPRLGDIDLKAGSVMVRRLKGSLQTMQPLYSRPEPAASRRNDGQAAEAAQAALMRLF
jgi:integrase